MNFRISTRLLGCIATLGLAFAATAEAADPPASSFPREFGYVTLRDGTRLAYVVYLPAAKGKFPTVLQYEPYVGAGSPPSVQWLSNGYALVLVNVRGTGCSQGELDLFGPKEGPDGVEVIDWIGRQPWSNRRVGMIGGSYPGHTQILVAAQQPTLLKAISPSAITASVYDEIIYPGGIFNVGFASRWSLMHQPGAEAFGVKARIGWGDTECAANYKSHPPPTLLATGRAHPFDDEWMRTRSLGYYAARVKVPTYISQTWQDNQTLVTGATEVYRQLTVPKRLALSPGGHGAIYVQRAFQDDLVRWMDRWLKGSRNGIEKEPPVMVYWEIGASGTPPAPSWVTRHDAWPVKEMAARTFYLTGDGKLVATAPPDDASRPATRSYTFPSGVELVGDNAQFALPPDPTGSLEWTSEPLGEDLTILGSADLTFFVSSENVDTDFVIALHDIYPNGDVQYLQRSFLRASMRRIDEARSRPDHLQRTYDRTEPLIPGQVYEIRVMLPPLGAVLRAGHRLGVALLAPSAVPQPDWGLLPLDLPGRNTVHFSSRYPSRVSIPAASGLPVPGPEPRCGTLAYQPCRRAPPATPGGR
ncbi:MAG: CocE/NonD family hydrolase [Gammaproteobacteria bacterium]|nr:CocE/NonD family hydrolase [Gammaproteobacteria bacterium]